MLKKHGLAVVCALLLGSAGARAADFTLSGSTDDAGPLAGRSFSGQFSFDETGFGFDGDVVLSGFSLSFVGQTYDLASADAGADVPSATFASGSFVGLSYVDIDSEDPAVRPTLSLGQSFDPASFEYTAAGGSGGFGSYSVSAVPEPQSVLLMLAGLAAVGWRVQRARRSAPVGVNA